ncbi:MAG TPA: LD-carboxypeptidase [Candidatus Acidoferrales bacterium]|nr:LD-carboxypeptidase [Candidatus Acidoferrales bacterium]
MNVIKPPRLKKGDLISIISPASAPLESEKVHSGAKYFESLGYRVTISKNVFNVEGYLAGTDEERAEDINQAFSDRNVKAIICSRGGYGTPRILDRIDYGTIRKNPKILVGYSDITALQLAIFKKTGMITFSGPMMAVEFGVGFGKKVDSFTEERFFEMITSHKKTGVVKSHKDYRLSFHGKKKSHGRLLGGNLSLITSILGTEYVPDFFGGVLLLEEVSEEPYSIDRMLTQLRLAGILRGVSAFALGQFTNCAPEEPDKPHRTLEEIFRKDLLSDGRASVTNIPYGHLPMKLTLPIGTLVSIDPLKKKFAIDEPAVS